MPDLDQTLFLAKRGKLSRAEVYSGLMALAEQHRELGQSEQQAFAKYISGEGRELYQVMASLAGRDVEAAPASVAMSAPPSGDWHDLVAAMKRVHKRAHPYDSDAKADAAAVSAAMSTLEGVYLFKQQKRAEQIASGQYTVADMACLDGAAAQQQSYTDMHKRSSQSEFEDEVDKLLASKPHMKRGDAMDHIRATKPELWNDYKGKPAMAPTQWHSDHSGSPPTTPARTPYRPSDVPAVKQWNDMVDRFAFDYGFTREKSIEYLKILPYGKQAIERVIKAAVAGS